MQMNHIIFESDCQVVVQVIHTNYGGSSVFSVIISNIKNLLDLHSNFEGKFVKRQANLIAHLLHKADNSRIRRRFLHSVSLCMNNNCLVK